MWYIYIAGYATFDSTNTTVFNNCATSNVTLGSRFTGGYIGSNSKNIEINNSSSSVTMSGSSESSAFVAMNTTDVSLTGCYAIVDNINDSGSGGLLSQLEGGTNTIDQCFVLITGEIGTAAYVGGLAAGFESSTSSGSLTINDCYVVGDNTYTHSSPLLGYQASPTNIVVNNFYHIGDNATGCSVIGWFSNGTVTVTDSVLQPSAVVTRGTSSVTLNNVSTDDTDILGQLYTNWSSSIWTPIASSYPILDTFTNLDNWDGSYTTYNLAPTVDAGSSNSNNNENDNQMCFAMNTLINTDKGYKLIQALTRHDTIDGEKIISVVKVPYDSNKTRLMKIPRNCIAPNIPNRDLVLTEYHLIKYNGNRITVL